ncbi:MAG TPA: folylpolyglutamate synthase/dihydrofolate synthase family protein [Pirellulales bacterium]|jgi:dihydrofolate synthase/folylpolyglutamate synthase|nr:folylpolyglutamate synthase/dihydrofolate synthase family protein [Pirellulales bacterium]
MGQIDEPPERNQAMSFLLSRINYERALSIPYHGREFRLDQMRDLLDRLGNPQDQLKIIHVAGTKGKGSTSAMIAGVLSAAGYRTGLYTSPHVDQFVERIQVDCTSCTEEAFLRLIDRVRPIVELMDAQSHEQNSAVGGPTFFEILTAMAWMHFAEVGTDFAVAEVGLGGRLDSTNLCRPLISVITSISFDHMELLGNTLAEIAREKAGIIKPGIPVISGVLDDEPRQVIINVAEQCKSPLFELGVDFSYEHHLPDPGDGAVAFLQSKMDFNRRDQTMPANIRDVALGMLGAHQAANAAVAVAVLEELSKQGWHLSETAIRHGLCNTRLPARVEIVSRHPLVIVDAAHNVASVQALLDTLIEVFPAKQRLLVFASTQEKDVRGMLSLLLPHFEAVILTRYLNNPRAVDLSELESLTAELSPIPRFICANPAAAWQQARKLATAESLVCATGSFYLAAEMRAEITKKPIQLVNSLVAQ